MTTKQIINAWKNAENSDSSNNPVGNATVDSDILNRVLGGQDNAIVSGCIPDPFPNPVPNPPFPFPGGGGGSCPDDDVIVF
jgi:hypothetical protein